MAESLKWQGGLTVDTSNFVTRQELIKKQDKLTAGSGIDIKKNDSTGETVISYTGEAGGITEERAREIATEQANAQIAGADFAKESDIPKNLSDLNNDTGFIGTDGLSDYVKADALSAVATTGNYSDLTGTPTIPEAYDDSALAGRISSLETDVESLKEAGGVTDSVAWANVIGKPTDLVQDASYVHTDNNYTNADASKLGSLANIKNVGAGLSLGTDGTLTSTASGSGDENVIETVKVNGTALVPDSSKAVNISVPAAYDDTELRNSIASTNTSVSKANSDIAGLQAALTALQAEVDELKSGGGGSGGGTAPTITQPKLMIQGTNISTAIAAGQTSNETITLTFDRGTISSGGNTAGAATGYSLNGGAFQTSNVFNVTVSESNKTFKGKVQFGAGDQPKDSNGDNYGTPMAAGEIESGTIEYTFSSSTPDPTDNATIWSNAKNIMSVTEMTDVKKSDGSWAVLWVPQTEDNPEIFDVPASWNVTAVETINNLTNLWQNVLQSFDISDTSHGGVAYKRYTDNREFDDGGRHIRVTWSV